MNAKKLIIEGVSALLGIAAGAATAYFGHSPEAGATIGGAVYLASRGLGYVDPGTTIPDYTVSQQDIKDAMQAVTDVQTKNYAGMLADFEALANDVRTVLASAAVEAAPVAPTALEVNAVPAVAPNAPAAA